MLPRTFFGHTLGRELLEFACTAPWRQWSARCEPEGARCGLAPGAFEADAGSVAARYRIHLRPCRKEIANGVSSKFGNPT